MAEILGSTATSASVELYRLVVVVEAIRVTVDGRTEERSWRAQHWAAYLYERDIFFSFRGKTSKGRGDRGAFRGSCCSRGREVVPTEKVSWCFFGRSWSLRWSDFEDFRASSLWDENPPGWLVRPSIGFRVTLSTDRGAAMPVSDSPKCSHVPGGAAHSTMYVPRHAISTCLSAIRHPRSSSIIQLPIY